MPAAPAWRATTKGIAALQVSLPRNGKSGSADDRKSTLMRSSEPGGASTGGELKANASSGSSTAHPRNSGSCMLKHGEKRKVQRPSSSSASQVGSLSRQTASGQP